MKSASYRTPLISPWIEGFPILQARQSGFADWKDIEADFKAFVVIDDVTAVKQKCRLDHLVEYFSVIKFPVQFPVSQHCQSVAAGRLIRIFQRN